MLPKPIQSEIIKLLVTVFVVLQLVACGGGGGGSGDAGNSNDAVSAAGGSSSDAAAVPVEEASSVVKTVRVKGSIGDGPVTGAKVTIYNNNGQQIGTVVSDNTAYFNSTVKARGNDYPLLLKVNGGYDLVTGMTPDFQMYSVMLHPSIKEVNINPFATLIVKIAQFMPGGLNADNVDSAMTYVTGKLGFGLDPNVIADPIATPITDSNVANIIKASEALGETVRRTRDALAAAGKSVSGDDVIGAIAADMADGILDGKGAKGTKAKIAAVASVVSAQVLVEALGNRLKVGGVVATGVMDQAIASVRPGARSSQLTGSVRITAGMREQTRIALIAAQVVDTSSQIRELETIVSGITTYALPADITADLPATASASLDDAVTSVASAGTAITASINQVVRSDGASGSSGSGATSGTTAPANTAPVISGTPAGSVVVNVSYVFQPVATDSDGDKLTFSISNKPVWASFSATSGQLSGTPDARNTGTYQDIRISVTDGTDTTSLAPFSIRVDAASGDSRITSGLVAYYPFTEGAGKVVADQSEKGTPMDLAITGSVDWLASGNGVRLSGGRVGTTGAATKVIDALRASNTSTFEVWVLPENVTQSGPARMISVGGDTKQQNFMLGQERDEIQARLLHTGKDAAANPRLTTSSGVLGASLVHLVHTYDGAVERLYVNGVQHNETVAVGGSYSNWDTADLFSIGNEASLNRPYAGVIRLVAVYDRALGTAEILQNFTAGPGVAGSGGTSGSGGTTGGTTNSGGSGTTDPVNTAPVIGGTPADSVMVNDSYVFKPTATDADGDALTFSITNKPAWASFSKTSGRLSGTPAAGDAGTYGIIVISATDGIDTVSLPAFSIRVDAAPAAQAGSFTLNWAAPATRTDGTPLSLADIDGYRIYYGDSAGSYPNSVNIADGTAQTATVTGVPAGTHYVVMTTYDVGGRESGYSPEISKVAQ